MRIMMLGGSDARCGQDCLGLFLHRSMFRRCYRPRMFCGLDYGPFLSGPALMRSVEEWFGKTDDSQIPARVKLRVFERYSGVCYLTGRKIRPGDSWDMEHKKALCNGGE